MIAGLRLPFFSEGDPEIAAEGGIDPLGMAPIADRLADEIAPGVTARMSRVRYVTAICAASAVLESYEERAAPDGTPPYLVFEWLVVEAFARKANELPGDGRQIPGIDKARASILRDEPMCARNYLKTPSVFGFHGVYRTLAQALRLVDSDGIRMERGAELARLWEREAGIDGFLGPERERPGASLRAHLDAALDRSLRAGQNEVPRTSYLHGELARLFRPDLAGAGEKRYLLELLHSDEEPIRQEVFRLLDGHTRDALESDYLEAILPKSSPALATRLRAIQRFEALAVPLTCAFDRFAYRSAQSGNRPVTPEEMASDEAFQNFATAIPRTARAAHEALEALGNISVLDLFKARFAPFEEQRPPADLFEALLKHHETIQANKKPRGKRRWYEPAGDGYVIRLPYRLWKPREMGDYFVHPYRFFAMLRFLEDLQ